MLSYHKVNNINAKVGIYLRISLEDGDKIESNSIDNQRKLIYDYLYKNGFTNFTEFIDDGATGTNFNRKGFKDLLTNIENGNINTVITKDVSRIGRNYVTTGYYIEDYFVSKGVRYISILDDIDTYGEVIGNELLPFRAILNEMYSKDISLKQKSSLIERKKRGRYIACYAPYGYKKNKEILGKLDIDDEAAKIVKRTFELFLQGEGIAAIARTYTEEKIPTPAMHLKMKTFQESTLYTVWKYDTIKKILRNKTYLGHMIQNKETTISYKNHTRVYLDEKDYVIIYNHHLPIISEEEFKKANEILDSNKLKDNKRNKRKPLILNDLLYCADCNKRLARRENKTTIYYYCATRTRYHLCDNSYYPKYNDIEKIVLNYIKELLHKYSNKDMLEEIYTKEYEKNKTKIKDYNVTLSQHSKELLKVNNKLETLYNDKLNNVISIDMYKKYSSILKEEQKRFEKKINNINILINKEENELQSLKNDRQRIEKLIDKFHNLKGINAEVINEFIEKISIDKNRKFYINLKFKI